MQRLLLFDSSIKRILGFLLVLFMIGVTITSAMAMTWEPASKYVLSPGTELDGQIVLYDIPFIYEPEVTVQGPFITVIDEIRQGDLLIIEYTLNVPENTPINRYPIIFSASEGDESVETTTIVDVQGKAFSAIHYLFSQQVFRSILFYTSLFVGIVVIIILFKNHVHNPFHKRSLVYTVILLSCIIGIVILYYQSDIIVKHPGANFTQSFRIESTQEHLGSMQILRNENTPIAADWVTFDDTGNPFIFFSTRIREEYMFKTHIDIPDIVKSGVYYYDIKIVYMGEKESEIITKRFRVVS